MSGKTCTGCNQTRSLWRFRYLIYKKTHVDLCRECETEKRLADKRESRKRNQHKYRDATRERVRRYRERKKTGELW